MDTSISEPIQKPQWYKQGTSGNPKGKPKGTQNYNTLLKKAVRNIADSNGKPVKAEMEIIKAGYLKAVKGNNTAMLIDLHNRLFGVPKPIEQQQVMQPIIIIPSSLSEKYTTVTPVDNSIDL